MTARILDLTTMYCGKPGHDKVYGAAVRQNDDGSFELVTFDGGRVRAFSVRSRLVSSREWIVAAKYASIVKDKSKEYQKVDWRDQHFRMERTVRSIGLPPGESVPQSVSVPPVSQSESAPRPNRKSSKPSSPWEIAESIREGEREF